MEVTSDYVGAVAHPIEQLISARHSMNFAAATNDLNPVYLDDEREGGIVAPPMISVSLTWPLGEKPADHWDAGQFPVHLLKRQVHFTETIDFHRMMRPGDTIHIKGDLMGVTPHRAGAVLLIRCKATNGNGEPVFTEYAGSLLLGVKCVDSGKTIGTAPDVVRFRSGGEFIWDQEVYVSKVAAHLYDGCGDLHNPIHTSPKAAKAVGLPMNIVHGTWTLSTAVREILDREGDGDPERLKRVQCRFSDMVLPDSTITVRLLGKTESDEQTECHFEVLNATGKRALRDGHVILEK